MGSSCFILTVLWHKKWWRWCRKFEYRTIFFICWDRVKRL